MHRGAEEVPARILDSSFLRSSVDDRSALPLKELVVLIFTPVGAPGRFLILLLAQGERAVQTATEGAYAMRVLRSIDLLDTSRLGCKGSNSS